MHIGPYLVRLIVQNPGFTMARTKVFNTYLLRKRESFGKSLEFVPEMPEFRFLINTTAIINYLGGVY
jgi:hypothetical protein